jgi:hypothetical protein
LPRISSVHSVATARIFKHAPTFLEVNKLFIYVARVGEERKAYKVLVGKPEGKRPFGRPRRRWEDGIRMDLRDIGSGGWGWIGFDCLRTGTGDGLL